MGKIFYIMGKSASGKDHIYARLMKQEDLHLQKIVMYTTRPLRDGEKSGREYFFVDEEKLQEFEQTGKLIENRAYHTVHGIWNYFTADDGQIDPDQADYLGIGTLESYVKLKNYYGEQVLVPIYLQVEAGELLTRALTREKKQETPKYAEMCRRFLADEADFSEENIKAAGISRRFENVVFDDCAEEIIKYIKSMQ
ncbi:MAG: guanylate kinase [Blautia sp.]|nr:guanylate kinase [Blautia sp.]